MKNASLKTKLHSEIEN